MPSSNGDWSNWTRVLSGAALAGFLALVLWRLWPQLNTPLMVATVGAVLVAIVLTSAGKVIVEKMLDAIVQVFGKTGAAK